MSISIGQGVNSINQFPQISKPKDNSGGAASFAQALAKSQKAAESAAPAGDTGKYDFTNMTPRTMFATMNKLIHDGKMTLDESTSLMGMIPTPLSKVNYDGNMPASFDQPWNFLAKIQDGISASLSRNENASATRLQQTYDALMRSQA